MVGSSVDNSKFSGILGQNLIQLLSRYKGQKVIEKYSLFQAGTTVECVVSCQDKNIGECKITLEEIPETEALSELNEKEFRQDFIDKLNELETALCDKGIGATLESEGYENSELELTFFIKSQSEQRQVTTIRYQCPGYPRPNPIKWCYRLGRR
jgi:hypothetical protein